MKVNRERVIAMLLGALLAISTGGCREEIEAAAPDAAPPVMLTVVEAHRVVDRIEATSQLLAKEKASIAAQVAGEITAINAEEGDAAGAGQVIVSIDPERRQLEMASLQAGVAEAEAALSESRREARRIEKLRSNKAVSESQLDEAQTAVRLSGSRLEAARARLGLAERALRDSEVRAPFAGFVARREVSRGEYVNAGQTLFDLVALDPIEVEFHLAEVDSGRATLDAPVALRVAPFPQETFDARVTAISPIVDPATRTLRVKAELPNPGGRLRPGLFARVDLGVSVREGVPMVPEEVVLQRADGAVVFRLVGERNVERINVQLGVYRDGLVGITNGLSPGDAVVIRGQAELINGSVVSLRNADGSAVAMEGPRGAVE